MTENKPIIIDGVDVSWCEHYTGNIGYLTDKNWTCRAKIQGTKCEDWSDCYFKRWQRKEQECEELKREIAFGNNGALSDKIRAEVFKELNNENNQLKAENEKYKKKFQEFFNIDNQECWNAAFLQDEKAKAEQKLKFVENVLSINYQLWMYYIANGINNSSNHTILDLIEDFATSVRLLANTLDIQDNTLNYYTKDSIVYDKKNKELQKLNNEVQNG